LDTLAREEVLELIQKALAPIVGETMSAASPRAISRKLGLDREQITRPEAIALIERVCQGLIVFVGRARALAAQQEILALLPRDGQGR
jgi:hypothetical protein